MNVIFGNIFSLGAVICDLIANSRKSKKEVLTAQYATLIFYILACLALNTYSALIQNILAIARNYFAIKGNKNKIIDWIIIALSLILGLIVNNNGLFGLLPIAANVGCSIVIVTCEKDVIKLKLGLIYNCILFGIFNFGCLNFVGGINNVVLVIWTSIFVYKNIKENKENKI